MISSPRRRAPALPVARTIPRTGRKAAVNRGGQAPTCRPAGPRRMVDKPGFSMHGGAQFRAVMEETLATLSSPDELITAVQRGSRAALKRLYELESRRLYGIALRIARRPEVAADAVQDAFIQVWQNAASFSPARGSAAAWLTGIVRFRALDAVRKLGREILSDDPALGDDAHEPDMAAEIDLKLSRGALQRCLGALEEKQRHCIVLAFVDGLSHAEIAARLPAPLGSVKSWVRRGLLSLRSCLEP
jgi:RNA polymerase sigma-70 factor, ECF subfamily